MKKEVFDCKKCIGNLDLAPFVTIARITGKDFLLFDSRFIHDSTRTLRMVALSGLAEGSVTVKPLSSIENVHSYRVAHTPNAVIAERESMSVELGVVTVDFGKAPFLPTNANKELLAEECEQLAALFLAKLRDQILLAVAETLQLAPLSDAMLLENEAAIEYKPAHIEALPLHKVPAVGRQRVVGSAANNKGSYKQSVFKWVNRFAIAAVVLLALLVVIAKLVPQQEPSAAVAATGPDADIYERIAAAARVGANNPTGIPNVTEQTLKSMGLDPGKAAANLGCLAQ